MLNIPSEEKSQLDTYLTEAAKILQNYTKAEKLNDFENIELEVRKQMMEIVSPQSENFFVFPRRKPDRKDSKSKNNYRRNRNRT